MLSQAGVAGIGDPINALPGVPAQVVPTHLAASIGIRLERHQDGGIQAHAGTHRPRMPTSTG